MSIEEPNANFAYEDAYSDSFSQYVILNKECEEQQNVEHTQDMNKVPVPPYSIQMEQAVLAALMTINESLEQVGSVIDEDSFYLSKHRLIFKAISDLSTSNMPYDAVMVCVWLSDRQLLDDIGGEAYLMQLLAETPASLFNLPAYAEKVRELAELRTLIDVLQVAYNPKGQSVTELLGKIESQISKISERHHNRSIESAVKSLNFIFKNVLHNIERSHQTENLIAGLSTGFIELDKTTQGMQKGDLILVAARPSMGKTIFAINLIECVLFGSNLPAIFFSMQKSADTVVEHLISSSASIKQERLRTGGLSEGDWVRLTSTMIQLQSKHLYVDDTSTQLCQIRAHARSVAKKHNGKVGIVIVDHLQLVTSADSENDRDTITWGLKELAKDLNCPVIALSQLSPNLEGRTDKRPILSDLSNARAIEQYADLIMFIYRDELYARKSKNKGIAEVIVAKNQNGPISKLKLAFQGEFARFTNLSSDHYHPDDIHATASKNQNKLRFKEKKV